MLTMLQSLGVVTTPILRGSKLPFEVFLCLPTIYKKPSFEVFLDNSDLNEPPAACCEPDIHTNVSVWTF